MLKIFVTKLMHFISRLYSYSFSLRLRTHRNTLYTMWISNFVYEFGCNNVIKYPCWFYGDRKRVSIGNYVVIGKQSVIEAIYRYHGQELPSKIVIGDHCSIGEYNHITAVNNLIIGNGLLTGRRVLSSNNNHGDFTMKDLKNRPEERKITSKGDLVIEDNVWIGEGASILGHVRIGEGAVVAANSVVTKDVPPYTLVAGVPAKVVKSIDSY